MTHTDAWSWFDAPELSDVDFSGHDVTAVLVCHNAGSWLNATLAGLGQSDRRPEFIVAVDNDSTDDTAELLESAYQAGLIDQIIRGRSEFSFGQGVERALSLLETQTRWLWLLHDDAIPDHDALTELLTLAARTPNLAIAVPLLVRPTRRSQAARTLEIGASISASGRRALGLEPDEVAQGQYESTSVLGGSTCGMLVKWQSLIEIGGFDQAISGYRDGVDIGWRAHLLGQWVLTCPAARIVHRQAGRSEIRQGTIAQRAGRSEASWDRLMGMRLVAAHARGLSILPKLVYLTLFSLLASLAYVLGRAPDHAKDEIQAWTDFFFRSRNPVARLRHKIAGVAKGSNASYRVRSLRPTLGSTVVDGWQFITRWVQEQWTPRHDNAITLDDLLGDEFTRRLGEGRKRIPAGVWLVLLVAGVAIMARSLYRKGLVTASGLLGAPDSVTEAFHRALAGEGRSHPWLLVNAVFSVLTVRPDWLPVVVMVLAFPVTLLVGVWYGRRRIEHASIRWLAAAGYACLPILLGGLNRGSLWLVAGAVLLPLLADWLERLTQTWAGARSLQIIAGIAVAGIMLVAITPVLWLPAMVIAMVQVIRRGGAIRIVLTGIAVVLPLGFWAPALRSYIAEPGRLLLAPEPMLTPEVLSWQMVFGRGLAVGLPPQWLSLAVFSVIWLGVLVVVFQRSWRRWPILLAAALIALSVVASRWPVTALEVRADTTLWLLIGFAVLLYCLVSWIDEILGSLEGRDFGGRQALVAGLSFLLICSFGLAGAWSAASGMSQVQRGPHLVVPQYIAQKEIDSDAATLLIDAAVGTWNLRWDGQTRWGQASFMDGPMGSESARSLLRQIVALTLTGRSDDQVGDQLASFGVSTVVVLNPSVDAVAALDATSGFQRLTSGGAFEVWNISSSGSTPTRWSLVTTGAPPIYLGAGEEITADSPRTLVLAMPEDPDRHVFVGGVEVRPTISTDWRSAYDLGSTSGMVTVTWTNPRMWLAWTQLALFVTLVIFVLPPFRDADESEHPRYQMRSSR